MLRNVIKRTDVSNVFINVGVGVIFTNCMKFA